MPKVSVIVPVYKVEKYIGQCIESILSQTFKDFELILVDDGSPDSSGAICDQYAQKDSRIQVFHKENGGVSSARNYGIEKAKGEWLCFVDSDDWIEPTYLGDFELGKCDADIYMQGYVKEKDGSVIAKHDFEQCDNDEFFTILSFSEDNYIINSPCFKLFKRSIVMNHYVRFDTNTSYGEDHLFSLTYVLFARSAHYSLGTGYIYRVSEAESLTQRVVPFKEITYYAIEAKNKHDMICGNNPTHPFLPSVGLTLVTNYVRTLKYLARANGTFEDYTWIRKQYISEMAGISTKKLSTKYKFIRWITLSKCSSLLYFMIDRFIAR